MGFIFNNNEKITFLGDNFDDENKASWFWLMAASDKIRKHAKEFWQQARIQCDAPGEETFITQSKVYLINGEAACSFLVISCRSCLAKQVDGSTEQIEEIVATGSQIKPRLRLVVDPPEPTSSPDRTDAILSTKTDQAGSTLMEGSQCRTCVPDKLSM
ncbi:hypothetical protein [Corynebacterium ulcerans]|nr:hypothetical protein [Corynebacterium ulcerans]MBH5302923.1 hypothetical protein [Corynebacterium ulcerans]